MKLGFTLALLFAAGGFAAPACTDVAIFNPVVTTIGSCELGPFTFSGVDLSSAPPGSQLFLVPFGTGYINGAWDLGFQLATVALPPVDVLFFYQVDGPLVGVENFHNGFLGARIQEVVCAVPFVGSVCPTDQVLANLVNPPTMTASFPLVGTAYIKKNIQLSGDEAFLSSFVNGHVSAPEPAAWMLIGIGLMVMALVRRRFA